MDNLDDDLARAITLSLMGHRSSLNHGGHYHDVAELQFQQDLQYAIEASSSESNTPSGPSSKNSSSSQLKSHATTPSLETQTDTIVSLGSFLGKRAQLEKERLVRLKQQRSKENRDELSSSPAKRQNISTLRPRTDERTHTPSTSASCSKASN
ncbi:hypothetical protein EDD16DRAFT_448383 [Pisolithus croceorrhizus]|nr:hypothetical protein EDD16DRAFT_448383 [Pisolithus croceorrhizus]KAI6135290.1 hypothetical protein EV401DRAFT_520468 [Pisolithus croceorrhizus]